METQWPLVIFSLLAGGGAATLAFAGIAEFLGIEKKPKMVAAVIAIVLLIVGGIASVLHLGQPGNVMAAATNIFSFSPISLELLLLGLTTVVAIIYAVSVGGKGSASKVLGIIGIIAAAVFCYVLGSSYSGMEAQTTWNSFTLVVAYWASAAALGGLIFLAVIAVTGESEGKVNALDTIVLIAVALQLVGFLAFGAFVGFDAMDALLFWGWAVALGSAVPLAALGAVVFLKSGAKYRKVSVYGGLVTVLIGGIAIRALMWAVGNGYINAFDMAFQNRGLFIF